MAIYSKPPLSVLEQINLLESRGLRFADRDAAAHYLTHISYYRLRAYWLPFEDSAQATGHQFRAGVEFDDILALYVFDRELRLLVLDAIERVEVSFRAAFTHNLAMESGSHAHLIGKLFNGEYYKYLCSITEEISRSSETFISHYRAKYESPVLPPVWAATEIMSLGLISRLFKSIESPSTRQVIAKTWKLDEKVATSLVHHFAYTRNVCAHHSRLWNRRFTVVMKIPKRPSDLASQMNPAGDRNLHNTLVALAWVLDIISPNHTWKQRLLGLLDTLPSKLKHGQMGFPADWKTKAPWA